LAGTHTMVCTININISFLLHMRTVERPTKWSK